jgi:hypothetical protein
MNKIVLIACAGEKLPNKARAEELYTSTLFALSMKYAKSLKPHAIFILSAKYGLTALDREIEPYELILKKMKRSQVENWAEIVLDQLRSRCNLKNDEFVILAGEKYRKYLVPHMGQVEIPLRGMRIGEQLKWLKEHC